MNFSEPCVVKGKGLHTQQDVAVALHAYDRVAFKAGLYADPCLVDSLSTHDGTLCSQMTLECGSTITTYEHLLAALNILGVSGILIEVRDGEVPILDGCALTWIEDIKERLEPSGVRYELKLLKEVTVRRGDAYITATPSTDPKYTYTMDFDNEWVKNNQVHSKTISLNSEEDLMYVAGQKTFVIDDINDEWDLEKYDLDAANVISDNYVTEGMAEDALVSHKLLDILGDTYVNGSRLIADIDAFKSGHSMNNELMREIISDPDAYEIVTVPTEYDRYN